MNQVSTVNIAVLGASGYTGAELLRLLLQHPHAYISALAAYSHAGKPVSAVFPHLYHHDLPNLVTIESIDFSDIDLVFCCLPHGTTQPIIASLPGHVRIIDLSADFRLHDAAAYQHWYGKHHQALALQSQAVYGLSEHYRDQINDARLVANPGCYPTCSLLPLLPLVNAAMLEQGQLIIDAKSGVSGAGRAVKESLIYNEVAEGLTPYSVNQHRHKAEMMQELHVTDSRYDVTFVPHLIPQRRGMVATMYARLANGATINDARVTLQECYAPAPFVQVLGDDMVPSTHHVRGSNQCYMNVFTGSDNQHIILISAIDNLMKGASGQAVHNMNLMYGFDETAGLTQGALFP